MNCQKSTLNNASYEIPRAVPFAFSNNGDMFSHGSKLNNSSASNYWNPNAQTKRVIFSGGPNLLQDSRFPTSSLNVIIHTLRILKEKYYVYEFLFFIHLKG